MYMVERYARAWVKTSVNIMPEMHKLARENFIRLSEAMRRGISLMLAEKGIGDYDNDLNITRRLQELKIKTAEVLQREADKEVEDNDEKK